MNRRAFACFCLALAMALPASGQTPGLADRLVRDLVRLGFETITVERTLLGRTRITAAGGEGRREIIFNPVTGEIMRDLFVPSGRDGEKGGQLTGDDDDDDDNDDDDDGDDADGDDSDGNSGQGRGRGRGGDDD
jgi:hypothetical protein